MKISSPKCSRNVTHCNDQKRGHFIVTEPLSLELIHSILTESLTKCFVTDEGFSSKAEPLRCDSREMVHQSLARA